MAFNVGFAQVTVRPSFAGFQTEAKRAVNSQMPAVGAAAGAQMASGVKKAGAPAAKGFSETASKEMAKPATTTPFAGAGKRAGTAFIGSLKSALAPMAGVFAAAGISNFVKSTVNDASALGESLNAVNVTFGKNAAGIKKLGEEAARSVGLSNVEFNSLAVRFSAFTDKIAGEGGDVVGIMKDLTGRASDFASVMNLEVNEAAQLFQSGLAGESEPLRRYGLDLSAAAVEAYAYANGIAESGEQLTENQKIQARYALIMEQTAKMQGDFANTSDSLANSQRILKSEWTNLKAELGNNLIPVFERLVVWAKDEMIPAIRDLVNWIKENKDEIKAWAIAIGSAAVAFGVLKTALAITGWISEFTTATGAARLAMLGFNASLLANPIGLVIGALALLVGAVVYAYNNIEGFRNFVDTAWATIKKAISDAWENGITPACDAIKTWISDTLIPLFERFYRDVIVPVWDGIKWAIDGAWNSIKLIFDLIVWAVENTLGKAFTWFLDAVIRPVWDAVQKKIEEVWDNVKPVLQALGDFVKDTLAPGIKEGIDKIKGFFDSLREAAAKPINFVIETVYNNGIRAVFEKVAKAIGSDARLPYASPIGWGSTSQGSSGGGAMRACAKGGFAAPGLALVGEEGPELVDFRTPGRRWEDQVRSHAPDGRRYRRRLLLGALVDSWGPRRRRECCPQSDPLPPPWSRRLRPWRYHLRRRTQGHRWPCGMDQGQGRRGLRASHRKRLGTPVPWQHHLRLRLPLGRLPQRYRLRRQPPGLRRPRWRGGQDRMELRLRQHRPWREDRSRWGLRDLLRPRRSRRDPGEGGPVCQGRPVDLDGWQHRQQHRPTPPLLDLQEREEPQPSGLRFL